MDDKERIYQFTFWGTRIHRKNSSVRGETKKRLFDIINNVYNMGGSGFLFTSYSDMSEIKKLLPDFGKSPYLIVDITDSVNRGDVTGFFPKINLDKLLTHSVEYQDLELDTILDKIASDGIESLTSTEMYFLDNYSDSDD